MEETITKILDGWPEEIHKVLAESPSIALGVFPREGGMVCANGAMLSLLERVDGRENPSDCFVNPTLLSLFDKPDCREPVFRGVLTLSNGRNQHLSFSAVAFKKNDRVLVSAEWDVEEISRLNEQLVEANREINNLQRQLIKEKKTLEETLEKLRELDKLKNHFLGMAAHDLRNPLVSIRGFSELLMEEHVGLKAEDQKEYIEIIHTASQQMLSLVNDLLDVSVIESGKLDLDLQVGSMRALIEKQIRIHEVQAKKKQITIKTDLKETPDVMFDPDRIAQVIDNFISNAIKFSPSGTQVEIRHKADNGDIVTSVVDTGPGINAEEQAGLFGEFQRAGTRPTGGEKSTGLGLAIAKKIVSAHNGKVGLESEPGKGSTFYFALPAAHSSPAQETRPSS